MRKRTRKRLPRIGIALLTVALLAGGCLIYLEDYYHADAAAASYTVSSAIVERTLENGALVFDPGCASVGFIFYPGGKVEHTAYVPLMRELAARDILCVLCPMPFRLAVFDTHAADEVRAALPGISRWYVGGHSLGGAMAAAELSKHADAYEGLILLAAYSTNDLSSLSIRALSLYGSEDGVMNRETYQSSLSNLPAHFAECVIEGGCHAGFGLYGAQDGDGIPAIDATAQIRVSAEEIASFIDRADGRNHAENP